MKKISLFFCIAFMLCYQLLNAQDIFKQHGFTKEPLTLSNGSYNEFFDNNDVVQIGTVLLNTKTNKMVAFVEEDSTKTKYLAENSSRWLSIDAMASKFPEVSPYVYVRNNPILRLDPNGLWDVTVHVYNNRVQHGYGIAVVTDRKGNEVARYDVRAIGQHRNRTKEAGDTPLGVYDIPNKEMWKSGGSTTSYGPNSRLLLFGESGEIMESSTERQQTIRMHGGRQGENDKRQQPNEPLQPTEGCLRMYDNDIASMKSVTENLMSNDSKEVGGKLTVKNDLEMSPSERNYVEVKYDVPKGEREYWKGFVNNLLKTDNK